MGHAIGRWGNFFNQELYGVITDLPWGIYIEETGMRHHPLFLYESLGNLVLFFVLLWVWRRKRKNTFCLYLIGYGVIRFWLEFLKVDIWLVGGLNVAQIISLLAVVVGILLSIKISLEDL